MNDEFGFVEKYSQSTNLTPYMIVYELKDLSKSAVEVAAKFNVSDTFVHYTFLQYVSLNRFPLPRILCVDEVYLNFNEYNRYCLVLMDFLTGEIIDILPNRNDSTTSAYFRSIPKEERDKVEYLICDMYNPYINYTSKYFKNAKAVVDSFHVVQWIILKNNDTINYTTIRRYNKKLRMYVDTCDLEKAFMELDENFYKIRELKEKYISFNQIIDANENELNNHLSSLINEYKECGLQMFIEFAELLTKYKTEIINSFTRLPKENQSSKCNEIVSRLSNGPMEGFNRKPKDLKRDSRGFSNFEYTRNRILWSTRDNASVLAIPKPRKEVQTITGKHRGKYKKQ